MVAIALAVTGLFFVLSVALISPPSANRALPIRIYLTVFWLLGGLLTWRWVAQTSEPGRMLLWTSLTFAIMVMALVVVISNSDQLSQRVRRAIPRFAWKRFFAFFFFNGAAGGLIWAAAIFVATYIATKVVQFEFASTSPLTEDDWDRFVATSVYTFDYALTGAVPAPQISAAPSGQAHGVARHSVGRRLGHSAEHRPLFREPAFLEIDRGPATGKHFNVYLFRDTTQLPYHLVFRLRVAVRWPSILNAKWFFRQVQNFRPLERADNPPASAEMPPAGTA